jgi:hypothetical protein
MIQKQLQHKENTTRLYPENNPRKHSEESEQNYYNFQLNLNKQAKAQYVNALQTEQSDAPCNFVTLNHLYLMRIALIKEISRKEATPLQDIIHP